MNEADRLNYAQQLQSNPLFIDIFKQLNEEVLDKMRMADLTDEKALIAIASTAQVVETIDSYVQSIINTAMIKAKDG